MRIWTFLLVAIGAMLGAEPVRAEPPLAVVYRGAAGCDGCSEAVAAVLQQSKYKFRVVYAGPREKLKVNSETLKRAALYAQPGGGDDIPYAVRALGGSEAIEAVRDFVAQGGRYLGICMGAYLAAKPGFELIEGRAVSYVGRPGSLVDHDEDTVTPVIWRGKTRHVYYQSGSAMLYAPGAKDVSVIARYPNDDVAASISSFGKGRVGVIGPHPEADRSWYDAEGLTNPDGYRTDLARDFVHALMAR